MLSRPGGNPAFNSIEGISNSNFGLRTCFDNKNTKELCLKAITPLYYKMSYLFLIMIAVALLLNGIVLFLYVKGYSKFGKMLFYYLTFQLVVSNILYCISFMINRETWMIFYEDPFDESLNTDGNQLLSYISSIIANFYSQMLPLGILVMALHRLSIFIFRSRGFFEKSFLIIVIATQWVLIILISTTLTFFDCQFGLMIDRYNPNTSPGGIQRPFSYLSNYTFSCESFVNDTGLYEISGQIYQAEQVLLPGFDILIYIVIVLHLVLTQGCSFIKRASLFLLFPSFLLFVVVETSSLTALFIITTTTTIYYAIVVKRIVNIIDLTAASLIPIIIFATNSDVRQMLFPKRKRTVGVVPILSDMRDNQRPKSISPHRSTHAVSHHD